MEGTRLSCEHSRRDAQATIAAKTKAMLAITTHPRRDLAQSDLDLGGSRASATFIPIIWSPSAVEQALGTSLKLRTRRPCRERRCPRASTAEPRMNEIARSYDAVAEAYAARFFRELDAKPLDRALLNTVATEVRSRGRLADLGCGPGHVARYLHERGVDTIGIDLSRHHRRGPALVAATGVRHQLDARAAFRRCLACRDCGFLRDREPPARGGVPRISGGAARPPSQRPFLFSFHMGDEKLHVGELLGVEVALDFYFFPRSFVERALESAGLTVYAWLERKPYTDEHPSMRAYVLAR